jgi:hypothetical protein
MAREMGFVRNVKLNELPVIEEVLKIQQISDSEKGLTSHDLWREGVVYRAA